jgi:hypothetical protein
MSEYDVSDDGKEVVFSTENSAKASNIWLARLDASSPPKQITSGGEGSPHFGPNGQILFRFTDGKANYMGQIGKDGTGRSRVLDYSIDGIYSISPDRRWIVAGVLLPNGMATMAVPIGAHSSTRKICRGYCPTAWAPDGTFLYVGLEPSSHGMPGKTLAIPIRPGQTVPDLPANGIHGPDTSDFPGSIVIDAWQISPGPIPSVYAYVKTTMHRNLFRIRIANN